jgi:hypothetical protein
MKKLFVLVGCISLILFSCHKNHDPDLKTQQKPGLINPDSKRVFFRVTDIYSRISAIRRRIDIINKKTNVVLGKMFITLSCNDPNDNLYRKIKYEPEKFSGQITLESSHLIEFTKRILNGKLVKVEKLVSKDVDANSKPDMTDPKLDPVSDPIPESGNTVDISCPFFQIAACANNEMENMYWLDFAFCAIKGNYCLIRNFALCAASLCKKSL